MRLNMWRKPNEPPHPFRQMRNDYEAGGSSPIPWLKSKIERPTTAETEEKMTRRELEVKIASLETIIKGERWPPKEREARMESDSSAETAKESEEKKQRIQKKLADEGSVDVNMVYTPPQSFKAQYIEYEEIMEEEIGLIVAQLQLEDAKPTDAVVFEKPSTMQTRFVRPLFIRALIEGRPVGRVMVDGGAMVNVMPTSFFRKLGRGKNELKPTDIIMTDFTGSGQQARGVLTTEITVGSKTLKTTFFVVNADSHYNLLLGRDWIHANECVPSTLHGKLFQWIGDKVEEIWAEGRPQMVDINAEEIGHINWVDADPD
uniref:Retrotransposon protein, putative, unclassified n=1 Tax=Ananas comosus var. bracteatus TaxID=296719 RepID=A0A6V7P2E2_ANACO|nr:unnamed protein product [Ananas comosus var. bracteatus]